MESKSRVLIFGGTGYLGKHLVKASIRLTHPTFVYSRPLNPLSPASKIKLLQDFNSLGVNIVHGELEISEMVAVIQQVDIVICALAYPQVPEQLKIIEAIKIAGNIKRFLPSDFGCEEDKVSPLPPFEAFLEKKRKIRRAIEAAHIPYTFVSANGFGGYFLNLLLHPHEERDDIDIFGTGDAKVVLNHEDDIAMYTIKVADDPRTCNKIVIYRPPQNIISQLELLSLWEKKKGRNFDRVFVSEEEIVKLSKSLPPPKDILVSIIHSIFVKGDLMNFEIGKDEMEASELYPEIKYTNIDQMLDIFLKDPPPPPTAVLEKAWTLRSPDLNNESHSY